ncbi:MAG TPA: hypothetical protein VFM18_18150 [Methanosarcina sp.]|nr:hypothetical protein [Methanosarcina sp.]
MTINNLGEIERAYVDECVNYTPDKNKPTGARSVRTGAIHECKKYVVGTNPDQGCYWCLNHKKDYSATSV